MPAQKQFFIKILHGKEVLREQTQANELNFYAMYNPINSIHHSSGLNNLTKVL
jgi:hypothetical protein